MSATYVFYFPLIFQALLIRHILCFVLTETKFQSLEAELLPPEEANLDAMILALLLLNLPLWLPNPNLNVIYLYC